MSTIADFPYFEVEFTKEGKVDKKQQVDELLNLLPRGTVTDLSRMEQRHGRSARALQGIL
jgi:hypothetical protein